LICIYELKKDSSSFLYNPMAHLQFTVRMAIVTV
jgi:hypothetical protein